MAWSGLLVLVVKCVSKFSLPGGVFISLFVPVSGSHRPKDKTDGHHTSFFDRGHLGRPSVGNTLGRLGEQQNSTVCLFLVNQGDTEKMARG